MKRKHAASSALVFAGLVFALLGQIFFTYRRMYVWDGVFFWCVAILAFGMLLRPTIVRGRSGIGKRIVRRVTAQGWRVLTAATGILMVAVSGWLVPWRPATASFCDLFVGWLVGVALFLLAFVHVSSFKAVRARFVGFVGNHWQELVGLSLLVAVALVFRVVDLEHIPANLGGDEGTQGVAAIELVEPPLGNPFSVGWFTIPTMSFLAWGTAMRLFGQTVAGLRTLSAFIGAATVLSTFLLAQELWGRRIGWLAAAALASSHYHLHFSRLGSNQIADGLIVTLALWFFVRGLRSTRAIHFVLAGVVLGLGWYGYFGARLTGIILGLYVAWRGVVEYRFLLRHRWLLASLVVGALVVVAPLFAFYAVHPAGISSRLRQVSIFSSGWLASEQVITGRSAASLLLEQFLMSVSAFNYTLDPTYWYRASIPLLDVLSGVLFLCGFCWVVAYHSWPSNRLLLYWLWLALVLGWVLTENPPSSMRLLIVAPALAIFAALGLDWLVGRALRFATDRKLYLVFVALVLAAVAALNVSYYFRVYSPTRVYGNPTAEVATELGRFLRKKDDGYLVRFHAPPIMYWGFGTLRFLAPDVEGEDVPPLEEGEAYQPDLTRGVRFVFLPERLGELAHVRDRYPGGEEFAVHSDADSRLLYVLYEVSPR